MSQPGSEKNEYLLLISFFALAIPLTGFIARNIDDNRLAGPESELGEHEEKLPGVWGVSVGDGPAREADGLVGGVVDLDKPISGGVA